MSEFFDQLRIFSNRYAETIRLKTAHSPWGIARINGGWPSGVVIHYTANESLAKTVRWFSHPEFDAKVSAHAVVARHRIFEHQNLAHDLPLIRDLPATIVQTRLPSEAAWHATWANSTHYGIENVGAGVLDKRDVLFYQHDGTEWKDGLPSPANGRWWSPFTREQIEANLWLLHYLIKKASIDKSKILGHEQVQSVRTLRANGKAMGTDKRDPGPTYPIHHVRHLAGVRPLDTKFPEQYEADPYFQRTYTDGLVIDWCGPRNFGTNHDPLCPKNYSPEAAWRIYAEKIQKPKMMLDESFLLLTLRILGYDGSPQTLEEDLRNFQRMAGLPMTGGINVDTSNALAWRIQDRGYVPEIMTAV